MGEWDKYIIEDYKSDYLEKLNAYAPSWEKEDIMGNKYQKNRLSPEDRAQFARERRAVEGSVIAQKGFEGALVIEHIRGSQYLLRMPDGTEVFASHAKQRDIDGAIEQSVSVAGWTRWQERR